MLFRQLDTLSFIGVFCVLLFTTAFAVSAAPPVPPSIVPASMTDPELRLLIFRETIGGLSSLEARIHTALSSYLDNPETCHIRFVRGSLGQSAAGSFKRIEIEMKNTVIKSLKVARAHLVLHNPVLRLDELYRRGKLRFRDEGKVDFFLHVREEAVNVMLNEKRKKLKIRNPRMDLCDGFVRFRGRIRVLFFNNNIKVRGGLRVQGGRKIYFSPKSMHIDFLPLPGFVLRTISKKINPIADLTGFRISLDCSIIKITKDNLYLASESARAMVEEAVKQ